MRYHVHDALALDVYLAPFLEVELGGEATIDVVGHLNAALDVRGLHTGGHVDCVTPDVIEELACADHTGDHGSGRETDAAGWAN